MSIKLLYPSKGVHLINQEGTVAICTLWSPPENIINTLSHNGPVCVVGGLYGGGLNILLRNLLYNPQIDTLLVFGKELGHGSDYLKAYFNDEVFRFESTQQYKDVSTEEIVEYDKHYIDTDCGKYLLDPFILPYKFKDRNFTFKIISTNTITDLPLLLSYLNHYIPKDNPSVKRVISPELIAISDTAPSNIAGHTVIQKCVLTAWREVLFKLNKFGVMREFSNDKQRKELLNLKVVIESEGIDYLTDLELKECNLTKAELKSYADTLMSPEIDEGQTYSYGNRITKHFNNENNLQKVIHELMLPGDRRRCYITLWDNTKDINRISGRPCMVSLFFRKIDNKVHLTVNFRSHNGALAWIKNACGLFLVLKRVCYQTELNVGLLTIISHSISLDPNNIGQISNQIESYLTRHPRIKLDRYGYIKITTDPDKKLIHAYHFDHENIELAHYEGCTPQEIQHLLYINQCISDIGHAMYVGTQLEKAYICLNNNVKYVQDKKIIKFS